MRNYEGYTQGKWTVEMNDINDCIKSVNENGEAIQLCCTYSGKIGREQANKNAQLMAAAPELLKENTALKKRVKELEGLISEYAGKLEANLQKMKEVTNY